MEPKLINLRLLASLCNLNYLQISVKGKWLNSEKQILVDLLRSSFRYVPNFATVKYNSKISLIYHQIKVSKRYNEQVFNKTAFLKKFRKIRRKTPALESLIKWKCRPSVLKLYQKEASTQVFFCEYCEIFKNTFFGEHLWTAVWTFSCMSK